MQLVQYIHNIHITAQSKDQFNSIQSAAAKLLQGLQLSVCGSIKTNYFCHRYPYVESLMKILVFKNTFKPYNNESLSPSE